MAKVELKGIGKIYDGNVRAVTNSNITIEDKEFCVFVGPSGCGKSTILSILSDLEEKSRGIIEKDKNLTIGYMLQNDSLFFWKTILENCLIGLEVTKKLNPESKAYVIELLKTYGLYEFKDKYPSSLSGGMRQRVALIRTLAIKPDILLLD